MKTQPIPSPGYHRTNLSSLALIGAVVALVALPCHGVDHHTGVQDDKYKGCTEFSHVSVYQGEVQVYNPTNPSAPPVEVKEGQKVTIPCGLAPTFGEASLASTAALGLLGLLGAGAIAVAVVGATGGFGGHSNGPASPVQ